MGASCHYNTSKATHVLHKINGNSATLHLGVVVLLMIHALDLQTSEPGHMLKYMYVGVLVTLHSWTK